jgi:hypothetical protein
MLLRLLRLLLKPLKPLKLLTPLKRPLYRLSQCAFIPG